MIQYGPSNQSLPLKSNAQLICTTLGASSVKWSKNNIELVPDGNQGVRIGVSGQVDSRITLANNGTLFIDGKIQ